MAYLGRQKGIVDDSASKTANSKKKKKREEEKRVRDLVEFQLEQDRKKLQQEKALYEDKIEFLHSQLYEEQQASNDLKDELERYKLTWGEVSGFYYKFGIKI